MFINIQSYPNYCAVEQTLRQGCLTAKTWSVQSGMSDRDSPSRAFDQISFSFPLYHTVLLNFYPTDSLSSDFFFLKLFMHYCYLILFTF